MVSTFVLDRRFGLSQGFDTYDDRFQAVHKIGDISERKGDETARVARDWLDQHKDRPFFLFVHFYDPHDPYEPPEPFASQWRANPYEGEVAFADHCVGQVLEKLRQLGLYDDTIVVITGDHGEMLGEHGELNHGFFIYEGALRVPLVIRVPGVAAAPRAIETPASLVDIVPTLVSYRRQVRRRSGRRPRPGSLGRGSGGRPGALRRDRDPDPLLQRQPLLGVIVDGWKYIRPRAARTSHVIRGGRQPPRLERRPGRRPRAQPRLDPGLTGRLRDRRRNRRPGRAARQRWPPSAASAGAASRRPRLDRTKEDART